jgi:hypothetical protein
MATEILEKIYFLVKSFMEELKLKKLENVTQLLTILGDILPVIFRRTISLLFFDNDDEDAPLFKVYLKLASLILNFENCKPLLSLLADFKETEFIQYAAKNIDQFSEL